MQTINVIYASGALRKLLAARAQGASRELLAKLRAESLSELAELELRSGKRPHLRLVFSEGAVIDREASNAHGSPRD
jgi:hypothetical protein